MMMRRGALAALVLLAGLVAGCEENPAQPAPDPYPHLPQIIEECETNTAEVCGTWTRIRNTNLYNALWSQGSRALITAERFDAGGIVFTREDFAGPTPAMRARYEGELTGNTVVGGMVVWTDRGVTIDGTWHAEWVSED